MKPNSIEFGCLNAPTSKASSLRSTADLSSSLGYDRYWVPDQDFLPDPFIMLSDLARHTDIELGLAISSPFARHPVQMARAMASLIELHDPMRDWVLALGKGNSNLVLEPLGLAANSGPRRLATAIRVVKTLLEGGSVTPEDGGFVTSDISLRIDPVNCRVFLGSRGRLSVKYGIKHADGLIAESLYVPTAIDWIREQAELTNNSQKPHISWQPVLLLDDSADIPKSIREHCAMLMNTTAPETLEALQICRKTRIAIENKCLIATDIPVEDIRKFVAVGTPEQIREMVLAAVSSGITGWTSVFVGSDRHIKSQMEWFASDVMIPVRTELEKI